MAGKFFTSWAQGRPKNTGMGSLSLLQRIFPTQELNQSLLLCRQILYQLIYQLNDWQLNQLNDSQDGIKIAGRKINNLRYTDDITQMSKSKEKLKSLLTRVKEESEKAGLISTFMASGPITSWQIDGEKMEIVTDFIFLGSKITVDSDCSQRN